MQIIIVLFLEPIKKLFLEERCEIDKYLMSDSYITFYLDTHF